MNSVRTQYKGIIRHPENCVYSRLRNRYGYFVLLALFWLILPLVSYAQQQRLVEQIIQKTHIDDLAEIKKRKRLRVLVPYGRTDYFFTANGTPKGLQVDLVQEYMKELNAWIQKAADQIRVHFIPTTFDRLIPDLLEGKGDIVTALLTITPERQKKINFITAKQQVVQELVITHKSVTDIKSLDDLAGKQVYVLKGSSYDEHLRDLNINTSFMY